MQSITGTGALNLRFPGQWFQLETGLHYNWHRSYDPTLGRYTQPDPLGFVDGPSVYGYAGGSPQRRVDPNGLISLPPKPPGAGSLVCEAGLKDLACKFVLRYVPGLGKFAALNICSSQGDTSSGGSPQSGPPTKPTKDEVRDLKDLFGQGPDGASDALRQLEDGTKQVPPTLTRDALENYAKIARDQIAKGLDGSSVQATRLKIIERILGK